MEAALSLGVVDSSSQILAGQMHSTRYRHDSTDPVNDSEFDRTSLSSSPPTQASTVESDLSLISSSSAGNGHTRERRSPRSKRRSFRLSTSITVPPLPVGKIDLDAKYSSKSKHAQRLNDSMVYLDGPNVYSCGNCRTHLTSYDDIISKSFHGRHGRAYLFSTCVNVTKGPSEQRRLITGRHTVCDIFCKRCETLLGWTYLKAHESNQKYKEGRFIVEKINLYAEGDCGSLHGDASRRDAMEIWDGNEVFEHVIPRAASLDT